MDDSWEMDDVPDLLVVKENKERELKLLEERRLVEESDKCLIDDLFSDSTKPILQEPIHNIQPNNLQTKKSKKYN